MDAETIKEYAEQYQAYLDSAAEFMNDTVDKSAFQVKRKNKTLDGCPELTAEQIAELKADMKRFPHLEGKPYPTWALSNNNAEIRRVKERIEELSKRQEGGFVGWEFNGGEVRANTADNRLQIFFEEKPDEETRSDLKHNGFKWSPKANAWQRQLTENAYYAADRINAIQPLSGEKPTALQRAYVRQHNAEVAGNAVQSNAGEQRVGDHEEKITLEQARNAMLTKNGINTPSIIFCKPCPLSWRLMLNVGFLFVTKKHPHSKPPQFSPISK